MLKTLKKGVSALITTAIIVLISATTIALVLAVVIPTINRAKESAIINEAIQNMQTIDNTIAQTAEGNIGFLRSLQLENSGGEYRVNQKANTMEYVYYIKYGTISPGTFMQEGKLMLMSGVNAKASEYDLDGDGSSELVLENEILRVGLLRNGTAASQATINTSGIIKILNLKETNVNVTPADSSIVLDEFTDSSYGTGYSELIRTGDFLTKAEAVFHINATNVYYDVVYTLQSGADFLIVKIQNAYYK
jgi:hypothetical protein